MGFLENAKDAVKLVQQIDNLELYEKLISLQTDARSILDENWKLKDEVRSLKEELETARKTVSVRQDVDFVEDGGFYVRKSEVAAGKTIRYCSLCWTSQNGALVPLNARASEGIYGCDIHKSTYRTKAYEDARQQSHRTSWTPSSPYS